MSLGGASKINKDNQEYRDSLAKDLKDMRSQGGRIKDFAQDILNKEKGTERYQDAKEELVNNRNESINENHRLENEQAEKEKLEAEKEAYMAKMAEKYDVPYSSTEEDLKVEKKDNQEVNNEEIEENLEDLESLREEYGKLGNKIMEEPREILATFSEEEKKQYLSNRPNDRGYIESFLQDLNKFTGENGGVNYENALKYINFLKEIRNEDFSGKILSYLEVQNLRKKQNEIGEKISRILN